MTGFIVNQDLDAHYNLALGASTRTVETDTVAIWMAILNGMFRCRSFIHCAQERRCDYLPACQQWQATKLYLRGVQACPTLSGEKG